MKKKPRPEKATMVIRLDKPLKAQFDTKVQNSETGETAASVIRGLVREFVKKGAK